MVFYLDSRRMIHGLIGGKLLVISQSPNATGLLAWAAPTTARYPLRRGGQPEFDDRHSSILVLRCEDADFGIGAFFHKRFAVFRPMGPFSSLALPLREYHLPARPVSI